MITSGQGCGDVVRGEGYGRRGEVWEGKRTG